MAKRCVYYVKDNVLYRQDIIIDWELGFDRDAKREYIRRIQNTFPDKDVRAVDVTTASPDWHTRSLSPIYLKMKDIPDKSVEDYLADCKSMLPKNTDRGPFNAYIYLTNVGEEEAYTIIQHTAFFDVFHSPDKAGNNTQAYWCAVFKYLYDTGNTAILNDWSMFLQWFEIFRPTVVDTIIEQEREENPVASSFEGAAYIDADEDELPFT